MEIIPAEEKHAEYISTELTNFFSNANAYFKYPKYKDDYQIMLKHVLKRLDADEKTNFYFIQEEKQEPIGFVHLIIGEYGIGDIAMIVSNSKENLKALLDYSVDFFKESKINSIQIELLPMNKYLEDIIEEYDTELVLKRYKINLE